jgi:hypothetical protein
LGFPLDDYTGAEAYQMWAERMRQDWQHTSTVAAYLIAVNRTEKRGRQTTPDEINPMETGSKTSQGIPLNSADGFRALQSVAGLCPKR